MVGSADYTGTATGSYDSSWAYLPGRVAVAMPPLLLLIGVVGMLTLVPQAAAEGDARGGAAGSSSPLKPSCCPSWRSSSSRCSYDDLRQLLFACPAVALLLTAGWRSSSRISDGSPRHSFGPRPGVVPGPARTHRRPDPVVPVWLHLRGSPGVAAAAAIENDWGRVSLRELLPQVPGETSSICHPLLSADGETLRSLPPTGRPAAEAQLGLPHRPDEHPHALRTGRRGPEQIASLTTLLGAVHPRTRPGRNCEVLGSVERWRYFGSGGDEHGRSL